MTQAIRLGVFRRLDNRDEGLPDDSPRGVELHDRRKRALHDVFDRNKAWEVRDWGDTDDQRSHEFVELVIDVVTNPTVQAVAAPVLAYLGSKLLDAAVDKLIIDPVKSLIDRLRGKQKKEQLLDFTITLPNGIQVQCYPFQGKATLTITYPSGVMIQLPYDASKDDIQQLMGKLMG